MQELKRPEILAPAGTYEAMEAAVKAGCDAVYAGGSLFSARAYAGNFDETAFLQAIDYCHLHGVKVYMTLNTLLKDSEINEVVRYVEPYYHAGLDAVLVQDMGIFQILKEAFPDLPLHASTQMSISSSYGAQFAKDIGIERIVPSRELSLEEIKSIKEKVDIEIETFVHGAMCFAYSGKCLFSSFAGGRSGNRGRCAQPCRQLYELFDTGEDEGGPSVKEYLMSLKDMCVIKELPKLIDAGIDSFKIEGRMKNPYYVASVVSAYRRARDRYLEILGREEADSFDGLSEAAQAEYYEAVEQDFKDLQDIYNRGGFHSGYYFTDKGKIMSALKRPNHDGFRVGTVKVVKAPQVLIELTEDLNRQDVVELRESAAENESSLAEDIIELTSGTAGRAGETVSLNGKDLKKIHPGMEVYRTRNEALLERIENEILGTEPTVPVNCHIFVKIGEPLKIMVTAEGGGKNGETVFAYVEGDPVETASKAATEKETLISKLKKSGGSGLCVKEVACELDDGAFVPMSRFNQLRREAAELLKEKIVAGYHR